MRGFEKRMKLGVGQERREVRVVSDLGWCLSEIERAFHMAEQRVAIFAPRRRAREIVSEHQVRIETNAP